MPKECKGFGRDFKLTYELYTDSEYTKPYTIGEWERYVYGVYKSESPYGTEIDHYEYSKDSVNWIKMTGNKESYTNYEGNIYVRAVDENGTASESIRHLVRTDSMGPSFLMASEESGITENGTILVSVSNITDKGVGVDEDGEVYSFDGGLTWVNNKSKEYLVASTGEVRVKDRLANITSQPISIIKACSGTYVANATEDKILTGYSAWVNGDLIHGSMVDNGSVSKTLNPGDSYTIPKGFHNGSGKITVTSLADNTNATAEEADILKGKTAWVNGSLKTGTMTNNGSVSKAIKPSESYTIPKGYHDGTGKVTVSSAATATAADILDGKTAWVNGNLLTGTMSNYSNQHIWINGDNGTFYNNIEYTYSSGDTTDEMVAFKSNKTGYFDTSTLWLFGKKSDLTKIIKSGTTFLGVTGTYTSDATATEADILEGKTAYVNGKKITGTMPERAASSNAQSVAASSGIISVRILTGAYLATTTTGGAPEIKFNASEIGLTADKILAGQSVAGIDGTATSDATATAADIATGKTAYVNGELITGTMAATSSSTYSVLKNTTLSIAQVSGGDNQLANKKTIYKNSTGSDKLLQVSASATSTAEDGAFQILFYNDGTMINRPISLNPNGVSFTSTYPFILKDGKSLTTSVTNNSYYEGTITLKYTIVEIN